MPKPEDWDEVRPVARNTVFAIQDRPDSAWNLAAAKTEHGDPFCCRTEWALSLHETLASTRRVHVRESLDSIVALAEGYLPGVGYVLEPFDGKWLFGCPLLGEHSVDLLDAMIVGRALTLPLPSLLLSGLLPGSKLVSDLTRTFSSRYDFILHKAAVQCGASLEGGIDGYLARRTPHFRAKLRQSSRRAMAKSVTFERVMPLSGAEAVLTYDRMLAIESASWKGIGQCGMANDGMRGFYSAMIRRLAVSGSGRVIFARCGERDIGFIFGGLAGSVYRGQQFSYADNWKSFSIGNLMQFEQLRWLCEEGATRYDMGPLMGYKNHWTEIRTKMDTVMLRPKAG